MRTIQLHSALLSLTQSHMTQTHFTKPNVASFSLTQPHTPGLAHPVGWTVRFKLILRSLLGSGICACGTKEHNLQV